MSRLLLVTCLVLVASASAACQRRPGASGARPGAEQGATADSEQPSAQSEQRAMAARRPPAGATCSGRDDCTSDQVCVEGRCRYRITSVAGEVLASAARAQAEAGDWEGAIETYDLAFESFAERDAPVPPEIACGAAELILGTATDPEARERGARRADLCFRTTVPGDSRRMAVRRALARLRFEGLEIATFDADAPPERFFTREPTRPTVDAVRVDVEMPDLEPREPRSHSAVRQKLTSEQGRRTIAECFIQDWELRHDRTATAELGFRYSTQLRDMGSYDVYRAQIEIEQNTQAEDGFEPCLVGALGTLFDTERLSMRGEPWSQAVRITARIQ